MIAAWREDTVCTPVRQGKDGELSSGRKVLDDDLLSGVFQKPVFEEAAADLFGVAFVLRQENALPCRETVRFDSVLDRKSVV